MLRMITNRSPSPKLKPLPRAATRLSPPLMEGSEWHCKQWINNCIANYSRTVASVPRPPARSKGIHSPLQRGGDGGGAPPLRRGGDGGGASVYLCNIASVFWNPSNYSLKALVSDCETQHITAWNHGFQSLKCRESEMRGITFENCKQTELIYLQIERKTPLNVYWYVKGGKMYEL